MGRWRGYESGQPACILFLYLGRRGALCQFTLQLAAASRFLQVQTGFLISTGNTSAPKMLGQYRSVAAIKTFDPMQPWSAVQNLRTARGCLRALVEQRRPTVVVNLLAHIWSPILACDLRRFGIPFVTVVHDAVGHPGDRSGFLARWFDVETRAADLVVTLSKSVARQIVSRRIASPKRIVSLFLPDLVYGTSLVPRRRKPNQRFKLLFFGRILKYKGLSLLLDALELLRRDGFKVDLGVAGAGDIDNERTRLAALEASVVNRWIEDDEVAPLFESFDAVVASHTECSQSGVVAAAYGSGIPVVATPVGGMVEQIVDGVTGVLAEAPGPEALARAIRRLATDHVLYAEICAGLPGTATNRSTRRFLDAMVTEVMPRLHSSGGEAHA
jgi:glycosyltransferase involved in cell wall biosynthesis